MISHITARPPCVRKGSRQARTAGRPSRLRRPHHHDAADGIHGGSMPDMLRPAVPVASLLTGMAPMCLSMSAFHFAPGLTLFSHRRRAGARSDVVRDGSAAGQGRKRPIPASPLRDRLATVATASDSDGSLPDGVALGVFLTDDRCWAVVNQARQRRAPLSHP
jgi:hypothetical protein